MQFSSYTDFRTSVLKMIDGDDANSTSISATTLDLMIALGEQAVYYGTIGAQGEPLPGLRVGEMETALALTSTSNLAPLPADCIELKRVLLSGEYPLDYVAEEGMLRTLKVGGSGAARQYTKQGSSLLFFPALSDGTAVSGRYYKRFPDIQLGTLNAAFNKYPDVWLYAALSSAAPFIGEDNRIAVWKMAYKGCVLSANRIDRSEASGGSRLSVRTR